MAHALAQWPVDDIAVPDIHVFTDFARWILDLHQFDSRPTPYLIPADELVAGLITDLGDVDSLSLLAPLCAFPETCEALATGPFL